MSDERAPLPSDTEIASWTPAERALVAQALDRTSPAATTPERPPRRRRLILLVTGVGAVVLVPWIIVLGYTLPDDASVGAWRLAWIGFDTLLAASLAASAWAMWRRRLVALVALTIAAVTLLLDVWFDVTLSWGTRQQWGSVLLASVVELPVFALLVWTIASMLHRTGTTVARLRGLSDDRSILQHELPMAPPRRH